MRRPRFGLVTPLLAVSFSLVSATAVSAQLKAGPSARATTTVTLSTPTAQGQPAPTPFHIVIDYGVPAARGRMVAGALEADMGKVWRLGANDATTLTTDVDLDIGGTTIPKGKYVLLAETTKGAWKLVISAKVGGSAMASDSTKEVARIPMKSTVLATPIESLTMWLIPTPESAKGELRMAWGTLQHSVSWSMK